jgi:hypothetical protein
MRQPDASVVPGHGRTVGMGGSAMDDALTREDVHTVPTRSWHVRRDGRLQCDVRPQQCRLQRASGGCALPGLALLSLAGPAPNI